MVNVVSFGNPLRKLYNCLKNQKKPKSQYELLEKTKNLPVKNFPAGSWTLPVGAKTFTRVQIGKKSDESYLREVVTFYDDKNKIIKRCFKGTGMNKKIREYEYDFTLPPKNTDIGGAYGVNIRRIKTKEALPESYDVSNYFVWTDTVNEEQFVAIMFDKSRGAKFARKIHINKNEYSYGEDLEGIKATCIEYPINLGFEPKTNKKVLSVDISVSNNNVNNTRINSETNVKVNENDVFLPYRLMLGKGKQERLAQYFLNKKGLGDKGVFIETNPERVQGNASAYFSSSSREIVFKNVLLGYHPVRTAAHEAEHAYQHCQIGRLGRAETAYEKECALTKGNLTNISEIEEAIKYADARKCYPDTTGIEDLSKCKEYKENYLEIKANEAGVNALKVYEAGRTALKNIFKFVTSYNSF